MTSSKRTSLLLMTCAMSLHYFAYEFIRSSAMSLITSSSSTSKSSSSKNMNLAMACSSPCSLLLIFFIYEPILHPYGPRWALTWTTFFCAILFLSSSAMLYLVPSSSDIMAFGLYLFQNSYVGFLSSQHWAFFGSVLDKAESAVYFAPIAGVSSLLGTLGALFVSKLVPLVGLNGLLLLGGFSLLVSSICADRSYAISIQHGFDPSQQLKEKSNSATEKQQHDHKHDEGGGFVTRVKSTYRLFQRVPTLSALFLETLTSGSLSSLVHHIFVVTLQHSKPEDSHRAGYVGNFHALINATSAILQLGPLSLLLKYINVSNLWIGMPTIMLSMILMVFVIVPFLFSWGDAMEINHNGMVSSTGLESVAALYFVMKTMEYSVHGVASEMAYIRLDYESRFLGKEIIGTLASRVGRSAMSLFLSGWTHYYRQDLDESSLSYMAIGLSAIWFGCGIHLYRLVGDDNGGDDSDSRSSDEKMEDKKKK